MGQIFGIGASIREYPGMGSYLKIDCRTFGAVDLRNYDLKTPFKRVDRVK